jgi:prolipoprotein diacylglyceryl transferase
MVASLIASIPSPSSGSLHLGPLRLNAYGMCIALGMFVAVTVSDRRWRAAGGHASDISAIATWALPAGVIGARVYHVATDWKQYRGRWLDTLQVWNGGLGIWGGIALGTLAGVWVARRRRLAPAPLLDAVAVGIPLAQAIGRWGNWFNVELFGGPSKLPWALEVPLRKRPLRFADSTTFHPTFLYESIWNVLVALLVLVVQKRYGHRLKTGRLFAVYVAGYTFGRFFIERMRVDEVTRLFGLRFNEWTAAILFVIAVAFLVTGRVPKDSATNDANGSAQRVANPAQ